MSVRVVTSNLPACHAGAERASRSERIVVDSRVGNGGKALNLVDGGSIPSITTLDV